MVQPTKINSQSPPSSQIASGNNSISASPQPSESLPSARTPDTPDASPPSIVSETTNSSPRPPFVSVATGPLAQLSPNLSRDSRTSRGPLTFFSKILNRSPRSQSSSSFSHTPPSEHHTTSSFSERAGRGNDAPGSDSRHHRTTSLPPSPVLPPPRPSGDFSARGTQIAGTSPILSRTLAGLGRSASTRTSPSKAPLSSSANLRTSPFKSTSSVPSSTLHVTAGDPESLSSAGLALTTITPSRNSQLPLCGCTLDDKYLLIGTSNGLDFLPIPLPGSLPIHQLGKKKRKEIRKPIPLIKRTRFRELAVLSERSDILLAIAGRTDQVRVYALEGIRTLIQRKMAELDIRDGYPYIQDAAIFDHPSSSSHLQDKGKGKAPQSSFQALRHQPCETEAFPPTSPPPSYRADNAGCARRRPPPLNLATETSTTPSIPSPTSRSFSRRGSLANGAIVREVPTGSLLQPPSTPRTVRPQQSREFVANRKSSTATISTKLLPRPAARVDSTSDLADFLRESGPGDLDDRRNPKGAPVTTTDVASGSRRIPAPVSPATTSSSPLPPPPPPLDSSSTAESDLAHVPDSISSARRQKRWTIGGASTLQPVGATISSARPSTPFQPLPSASRPRHASFSEVSPRSNNAARKPDSFDFKRRPSDYLDNDSEPPSIPLASRQEELREHLANGHELEYVKLARTRGARLFRAVETKHKTYLAVLTGDEGERIELFTGSRKISLNLNRTFVLPETPRSIDFQLREHELIDIYLIYSQSIFALEPSTVRVREVGVGRRARGERTRERAVPSDPDGAVSPATPSLDRVFQPPDSPHGTSRLGGALADTIDSSGRASSTLPSLPPSAQSTPIPSPNFERQVNGNQGAVSSQTPSRRRTSSRRQLYSTFTQLAFIPPLPSGLLSSQWTIPPLYSDVAAGSSDLSPLLSPVSLLSGAAVRNRTRPGLFFVSRGTSLTGIVTAEGKIIKKPIDWSTPGSTAQQQPVTEAVPQRIEMLVSEGTRTIVVQLTTSDVKAIVLEEGHSSMTVVPPTSRSHANSTSPQPRIQFLSTHSPSQQLFFAQASDSGSSWTIRCLAARANHT